MSTYCPDCGTLLNDPPSGLKWCPCGYSTPAVRKPLPGWAKYAVNIPALVFGIPALLLWFILMILTEIDLFLWNPILFVFIGWDFLTIPIYLAGVAAWGPAALGLALYESNRIWRPLLFPISLITALVGYLACSLLVGLQMMLSYDWLQARPITMQALLTLFNR